MKHSRARRIALIATIGAIAATVIASAVGHETLVARWHIVRLRHGNESTQIAAAVRLGELGNDFAAPALGDVAALRTQLGRAAITALERLGPRGARELLRVAVDTPRSYRSPLVQAFYRAQSTTSEKLHMLLAAIQVHDDSFADLRDMAQRIIAREFSRHPTEATSVLRELYRSSTKKRRWHLLLAVSPTRTPSVDSLIAGILEFYRMVLDDPAPELRREAVRQLGTLYPVDGMNHALAALEDPDAGVRGTACLVLANYARRGFDRPEARFSRVDDNQAIATALAGRLADDDDSVLEYAIRGIRHAKPEALAVLERSDDPRVVRAYLRELSYARMPRCIPIAIDVLKNIADDEPTAEARDSVATESLAGAALEALRTVPLGPKADDVAKTLVRVAATAHSNFRYDSLNAIAEMGALASAVTPTLEALVERDDDLGVRRRAVYALGAIGERARSAAPTLTRALLDEDLTEYAATALERIGLRAPSPVLSSNAARDDAAPARPERIDVDPNGSSRPGAHFPQAPPIGSSSLESAPSR